MNLRTIKNFMIKSIKGEYYFHKDKREYEKLAKENNVSDFKIYRKNYFKFRRDRFDGAGDIIKHYFLQDIYFAEKIIESNVKNHYDIGSRLDGFISHLLASNITVNMIDIRPLPYDIKNLKFVEGNATNLENIGDESIHSLSSLHALEHFGLGRYGDPVDPLGWKKALGEFQRILKKNGILYLSVPIGSDDVLCFNAHRIYKPLTIINEINDLQLESFSYIKNNKIYHDVDVYGYSETEDDLCGLFIFKKL